MEPVKKQVLAILDELDDDISWDDLMYAIYVKQKISKGREEVAQNKVISHDEVKKRLLK